MPLPSRGSAVVAAATFVVGVPAVLLRDMASRLLGRFVARTRMPPRPRILVPVSRLLLAHLPEIGLFALGTWALLGVPRVGEPTGPDDPIGPAEAVYVSATTSTPLGYGDAVPRGNLRFPFAMEALTGPVLITWSASPGFRETQRHGREDHAPEGGARADGDGAPPPGKGGRGS